MSASILRLLIVGGSDAGVSAALRAKELDPAVEVTLLLADDYPNYSICGLPFYLSGEVSDWRMLAHRTKDDLCRRGIRLVPQHLVTAITPSEKEITATGNGGEKITLRYDKLIIATGAYPRKPTNIRGLELPGVFCLRTMEDSFAIDRYLSEQKILSVLIVGGGYIGMEMADAFTRRGFTVLVAGRSVLKTVDPDFGRIIQDELERHGVRVLGTSVESISRKDDRLAIAGSNGLQTEADMVLVAAGTEPATELARAAGVALGPRGAIIVTRKMETNLSDVYAAGDCVETWHRLLNKSVYLPLGSTAHKQGLIAGENAVGGNMEYSGTLGTQVVKIFDLAVARTGLRDEDARAEGLSPLTVETECWDHKSYYPGARRLRFRVTGDRATGRLLGAQIIGHWQAQVAKRVDILAVAISHDMKVKDVEQLDLSYTPPLGSPWDPVQLSAQAWCRALSAERA